MQGATDLIDRLAVAADRQIVERALLMLLEEYRRGFTPHPG